MSDDGERAPFAPHWTFDELVAEVLAGLADGESGDAKRIDGRALAVKASPMKGNSEHIVTGMAAVPPNFSTPAHSHSAEEIAVVLQGDGHVDIDGVAHPLNKGTILVTPADLVHVTHNDSDTETLVVLWFYAPPGAEARWVVETFRDLSSGLMDLYLSSLSHRMNEVMKVLTIMASIFIPLTFIAGIYGMNFNPDSSGMNMPELNWALGYPVALGAMAVIGITMVIYFKRKGWM